MIEEIAIAWFRGASDRVALETGGKSVVVYGPNGAGKTSFVDAAEYLLSNGRIEHLSAKDAGRRMEKAIVNTQIGPSGCRIEKKLVSGAVIDVTISNDGVPSWAGQTHLDGWDAARIILRQDTVAAFINDTKTNKYSALVPLIGLGSLETVAANLRALARKIEDRGELNVKRGRVEQMRQQFQAAFPGMDGTAIKAALHDLVAKYLPSDPPPPTDRDKALAALLPIIEARIAALSVENARHQRILDASKTGLDTRLAEYVTAAETAAKGAAPDTISRLAILQASRDFVATIVSEEDVKCPACGTNVQGRDFQKHVHDETERLSAAAAANEARLAALGRLSDALATVDRSLSGEEMKSWLDATEQAQVREGIMLLRAIDISRLRTAPSEDDLTALTQWAGVIARHFEICAAVVPVAVTDLVAAQNMVVAALENPKRLALLADVRRIESLVQYVNAVEAETREEIRARTETIIADISADMQRMWGILHPDKPIVDVRLYQDPDATKAIDIALKFYGRDQYSPRLTLSEGHRNSLGLVVFLALAKRPGWDKPLLLDDVVTSFDREHRSNIVPLLNAEFADRQVIIFTHQYDWYVELMRLLPGAKWLMKVLLDWKDPRTGIRWSGSKMGLDTARMLLATDAPGAASRARSAMDVQMAVIAEKLEIPVPFMRNARNEQRYCADLVKRFKGRAHEKFRARSSSGAYEVIAAVDTATAAFDAASTLWGNAATHGREVTAGEAKSFIDASEAVLNLFTCSGCGKHVWNSKVEEGGKKFFTCECKSLKWGIEG